MKLLPCFLSSSPEPVPVPVPAYTYLTLTPSNYNYTYTYKVTTFNLTHCSDSPLLSSPLQERIIMSSLATAEICDANASLLASGELRALQPVFKVYGQARGFSGPVVTLKVFEDNVLVRDFLEQKGEGRVLVVDGGGSMRCALVGGNLAQLAQNNGWAGVVVNGCVRDVDEINSCDVGVRALASHPQKSNKRGVGEKHVAVHIGGTLIHDGEWLYADTDGILVSKAELSV